MIHCNVNSARMCPRSQKTDRNFTNFYKFYITGTRADTTSLVDVEKTDPG